MNLFLDRAYGYRATAWLCAFLLVASSARALIPGACMTLQAAEEAGDSCCPIVAPTCQDNDSESISAVHESVRCGLCQLAHGLAPAPPAVEHLRALEVVASTLPAAYASPDNALIRAEIAPRAPPHAI